MKLKFTFKYEPALVAAYERNPQLHFFLSKDVGHKLAVVHHRTTNAVEFELPDSIAYDATLWCWAYVDTENDSGEASCNEAGSNFFYLRDLLNNLSDVQEHRELVVWNARRPEKGIDAKKGDLTLYVHKASFPSGRSPIAAPTAYSVCDQNHTAMIKSLSEYLGRVNAIFQTLPSTYESVKYLHLPIWQFGTVQVPGNAFSVLRADHSPESWWVNASRIALRRHYRFCESLEEAERRFLDPATSEDEVMAVVSKMHTAVVNQVATYLSDAVYVTEGTVKPNNFLKRFFGDTYNEGEGTFAEDLRTPIRPHHLGARRNAHYTPIAGDRALAVKKVNMEAFSLGRMRSTGHPEKGVDTSGDCEDLAGEIVLQSMELKARSDFTDPVLRKMHAVRPNYLCLQVLIGVRGAQLSDAQKAQSRDAVHADLGGHMAAAYMSKERLLQMTRRFDKAPEPFEGLSAERGAVRADLMMLEGTGLIDPQCSTEYAGVIDGLRYLIRGSGDAFQRIKFISPESKTEVNNFYRVVQSFCVADFADEYATQEFVVLKREGGKLSTGADYLEFRNNDPSVALHPQPEMKEAEILYTKQLLRQHPPIVAYKEPSASYDNPQPNEHLERVRCWMVAQKRPQAKHYEVVQLFPRYSQVSATTTASWIAALRDKDKIFRFEYHEENLGPNVGGYMACFYVAK